MKNINDKYHQMWFWWSSLSPLLSSSLWAFCPTLSVSPFHTLSSLRAGAGLAPPFPWHPSNFHKVQKRCSSSDGEILIDYDIAPPFSWHPLSSTRYIRCSFDWWRRWWWWWRRWWWGFSSSLGVVVLFGIRLQTTWLIWTTINARGATFNLDTLLVLTRMIWGYVYACYSW